MYNVVLVFLACFSGAFTCTLNRPETPFKALINMTLTGCVYIFDQGLVSISCSILFRILIIKA
ncbi:hypothetical protein M621_21755 [Serratia plymuthica S13]|uniref:Uncharacterized protein n=1 Tax=Serratia plymuthica S13 TaxID=1348660 RepID=S4YXR4_SERPL|nr:hypothetical protein M621_21755 [Serratia plymuthica S13]AHY09949.1 hypothetical protein sch_22465 [Serratia plymuthica]